jgi:hypothetical protein
VGARILPELDEDALAVEEHLDVVKLDAGRDADSDEHVAAADLVGSVGEGYGLEASRSKDRAGAEENQRDRHACLEA